MSTLQSDIPLNDFHLIFRNFHTGLNLLTLKKEKTKTLHSQLAVINQQMEIFKYFKMQLCIFYLIEPQLSPRKRYLH